MTYKGEKLDFRIVKANKKISNLPQAKRFTEKEQYEHTSMTSQFAGPGRYNDQENFNKLTKAPCSIVMKKPAAIPESESGKPCYIMIGHSMKFEPAFLSTYSQVKELDEMNLPRDCSVSIHSGMRNKSVKDL